MFLFAISIILISSALLYFPKANNSIQELQNISNVHDGTLSATSNSYKYINDELIKEIELKYDLYIEEHFEYDYLFNDKKFRFKEYNQNSKLDIPVLSDGTYPSQINEIIISKTSAEVMNVKLNDYINIGDIKYKIVGIGYFVEYTHEVDLDEVITPNYDEFQVIYTTKSTISNLKYSDKNILYKYQVEKLDKNLNIEQVLDDIEDEFTFDNNINNQSNTNKKMNKQYIFDQNITYEEDVAAYTVNTEIKTGQDAMITLSIIIVIISQVMVIILIRSILKGNRKEIGILIAEGIHKSELKKAYFLKVFKLFLLSMFFGLIIGYFVSQNLVDVYKIMFNIPYELTNVKDSVLAVILSMILVIICTIIVYYFAIRKSLNYSVLELIKNTDLYDNKIKKITISNKIKFNTRYKIYLMINNFKYTLLFIFTIIISSMMLIFSSFMFGYIKQLNDFDLEKQYGYQKQVVVENFITNKDNNLGLSYLLSIKGVDDQIEMNTFDLNNNELFNISIETNDTISRELYKDGVIVSKLAAEELGYKVGDNIQIMNPYKENEYITFKINGISSSILGMKFITSNEYVSTKYNKLSYNIFYVDNNEAKEILKKYPTASVIEIEKFSKSIDNATSVMWIILSIIGIISIIIAFVVISVTSYLVINSNSKTISIMKAIGYTNKEIKNITISLYKWVLVVVFIICYPIVKELLSVVINDALRDIGLFASYEFDFKYTIISFASLIIIYIISSNLSYIFLNKISLKECLQINE